MQFPSSLKLVVATWIAALLGALAGRSLAEASRGDVRGDPASVVVQAH